MLSNFSLLFRFALHTTKKEVVRDYVFARILLRSFEHYWDLVEPDRVPGPIDSK